MPLRENNIYVYPPWYIQASTRYDIPTPKHWTATVRVGVSSRAAGNAMSWNVCKRPNLITLCYMYVGHLTACPVRPISDFSVIEYGQYGINTMFKPSETNSPLEILNAIKTMSMSSLAAQHSNERT
jgi:hypothetical protein